LLLLLLRDFLFDFVAGVVVAGIAARAGVEFSDVLPRLLALFFDVVVAAVGVFVRDAGVFGAAFVLGVLDLDDIDEA
jgi:hypothetical protein